MQHIEEAGIHSGDSSCVLPPVGIRDSTLDILRSYTRKLALALKVVGLVNLQFAGTPGKIYNIEASSNLVNWTVVGTGSINDPVLSGVEFKPVIATDCGGNRELVSSPDVGWLIPKKDVAALAAAIDSVIGDPGKAARVAENARRHVVQGFSKELRISRLESLYGEVLAGKER